VRRPGRPPRRSGRRPPARTYIAKFAQDARKLEREGARLDQLNDALAFELAIYGVKAA
jgi:hypothetical protein